ncbi:MAG: hypothetical protein SFU25_03470 [Candidatus Caenarcaniphilales bacterium]|nr:hypothetical protein [Candidatus Caenarcaniphilales bacterium]
MSTYYDRGLIIMSGTTPTTTATPNIQTPTIGSNEYTAVRTEVVKAVEQAQSPDVFNSDSNIYKQNVTNVRNSDNNAKDIETFRATIKSIFNSTSSAREKAAQLETVTRDITYLWDNNGIGGENKVAAATMLKIVLEESKSAPEVTKLFPALLTARFLQLNSHLPDDPATPGKPIIDPAYITLATKDLGNVPSDFWSNAAWLTSAGLDLTSLAGGITGLWNKVGILPKIAEAAPRLAPWVAGTSRGAGAIEARDNDNFFGLFSKNYSDLIDDRLRQQEASQGNWWARIQEWGGPALAGAGVLFGGLALAGAVVTAPAWLPWAVGAVVIGAGAKFLIDKNDSAALETIGSSNTINALIQGLDGYIKDNDNKVFDAYFNSSFIQAPTTPAPVQPDNTTGNNPNPTPTNPPSSQTELSTEDQTKVNTFQEQLK